MMAAGCSCSSESPPGTFIMQRDNSIAVERGPGIRDYWLVVVRRKMLILAVTVTTAFVSAGVSLYMTPMYASTTSLLPPLQEGQSVGAGLAAGLPLGLGSMAGGFLGLKSPADMWLGILHSRTVKDNIVKRFDLRRRYGKTTFEAARGVLDGNVSIRKSKEEIIYITVEDMDPGTAAEMAKAFVEELDRINKNVVMTAGKRTRTFVEERLEGVKKELESAEDALRAFQERNKAIKLDEQSKAILKAIGAVKGELMAKEVELETMLSYATSSNPMVELLRTEVAELKNKLRQLEEGRGSVIRGGGEKNIDSDSFIPTADIPDLALKYKRLLRDVKIYETLYELLTKQYEMARIQEAKDTPIVQVLDVADIAETRSRPKRRKIVFLSTLSALVLSVFTVFLLEHLKRLNT
ncbi:MAG TPA: hypothetical protein ENJ37_08070 [Deltaproteobacteria bacterium]|nr:hypothetical protein [Deltaproteobacteria bacterium]